MPRQILYTDQDIFAGGAADLSTHTTTRGNGWGNINTAAGTMRLNGAGSVVYAAGTFATHAHYILMLIDPAFPVLKNEEFANMHVTLTFGAGGGTAAKSWQASVVGQLDTCFNGIGYGFRSLDLASTTLTEAMRSEWDYGALVFTKALDVGALWSSLAALPLAANVVNIYFDEYQIIANLSMPTGSKIIANFTRRLEHNRTSNLLTAGLTLFDEAPGTNPIRLEAFDMNYGRNLPITVNPTWMDYGSTAVIESPFLNFTDKLPLGNIGYTQTQGMLTNVGGFDFLTSQIHRDRLLKAYMVLLDNRLNPGIVDVIIGPTRWRCKEYTEMEIPLSPGFDTNTISLRGGGTRCKLRVFANEIPKTFRQ